MPYPSARLLRRLYFEWPNLAARALAVRDSVLLAADLVRARGSAARAGLDGERRCARCGLDARVPGVWLDANDQCSACNSEPTVAPTADDQTSLARDRIADPDARRLLAPRGDGGVDALVALSGGKDSLVTLTSAVELGLRVSALTLDNGFLLDTALAASRDWCARLGVPLTIHRSPMHDVVGSAEARRRLVPWPCVACFDRLSRALVDEALRLGTGTILTGLRYHWPTTGRPVASASEAFAAYAPSVEAASLQVVNVPAALRLTERHERELLERFGWADPGLTGHSTNCLLPAHFERLHLERLGRPHDSVQFVAREARQGVIPRDVAVERMRGAAPPAEQQRELARRRAVAPGADR